MNHLPSLLGVVLLIGVSLPATAAEPAKPTSRAATGPLPDPLRLANGQQVTTAEAWTSQRRPEVLELFRQHVYGRNPVERPADIAFKVISTDKALGGRAIRKRVEITFSGPGGRGLITLWMFVPADKPKPAPAILLVYTRKPGDMAAAVNDEKFNEYWSVERIVERGYAALAYHGWDVAADSAKAFEGGVFKIFEKPGVERPADAWGVLGAWAWGASRCMDYLQTDPDIDAKRVAVIGQSRGGKTALWCGAQDERFALSISNCSGSSGASIARGKGGETIRQITTTFPFWFCANYARYADREHELPVDQHELIALIAPRLASICSATADAWADPRSEFDACRRATPVYRLFGLEGLAPQQFPEPGGALHDGLIGYHLRPGKHDLMRFDWDKHMDLFDRHAKKADR